MTAGKSLNITLFFALTLLPGTFSAQAQSPPNIAVYRWGITGLNGGEYDAYPKWLGYEVTWAEDFMPTEDWENIEGGGWQLGPWGTWVNAVPGRRLILSVPLLPGDWSGHGATRGQYKGIPVSLEKGAKGEYNKHFKVLAENLVANGLQNTIVRLGWEFNGGWYTWRACGKQDQFAAYWRQVVMTMRDVPGAAELQFNWNPTLGWVQFPSAEAWPGDEYVDQIGLDVYDQSWAKATYPFPKDATPEQIAERQKRAWDEVTNNAQQYGLPYWVDFAKRHNKPLTIPEWGVCSRSDGHGGGDNPYFIEQMHRFINDPQNNVAFHCYFDVDAGDGAHQLSPAKAGNHVTKFPRSSQAFVTLFRKSN